MHPTRSHIRSGDVQNTRPSLPRSNILRSGPATMHPQTPLPLIRQFHPHIPPSVGSFSCPARAEYEDIIAHHDSSTVEGQANLLNDPHLLPLEAPYLERHTSNVDPRIEFLDVYRQRRHVNPGAMRELYHYRQKIIPNSSIIVSPVLPIPVNDTCQTLTGLGSGGGELGVTQYNIPHSVSMDTVHRTGLRALETSVYSPAREPVQQIWALSHSAQTGILRKEHESVSWKGVGSDYEKRIAPFPPAYPSHLQLATSESSEIDNDGSRSCLPQHHMDLNVFTSTVKAGKGDVQSSVADSSGGEVNEPVCCFISGGIKRYHCECGFESTSKGRMDRHRDSLRHSKQKYGCSCGRFFTRADSVKRHKKKCINQWR